MNDYMALATFAYTKSTLLISFVVFRYLYPQRHRWTNSDMESQFNGFIAYYLTRDRHRGNSAAGNPLCSVTYWQNGFSYIFYNEFLQYVFIVPCCTRMSCWLDGLLCENVLFFCINYFYLFFKDEIHDLMAISGQHWLVENLILTGGDNSISCTTSKNCYTPVSTSWICELKENYRCCFSCDVPKSHASKHFGLLHYLCGYLWREYHKCNLER